VPNVAIDVDQGTNWQLDALPPKLERGPAIEDMEQDRYRRDVLAHDSSRVDRHSENSQVSGLEQPPRSHPSRLDRQRPQERLCVGDEHLETWYRCCTAHE
jgi:hypothetical protein